MRTRDLEGEAGEPTWTAAEERYAYDRAVLLERCPPPCDLVDLCAAPGVQSIALARAGYRVTAVDLGEALDGWGDSADGSTEAALVRAGVEPVLAGLDAPPLPLADGAFDVAVLTEVLEHLREYPLRTLAEVRRILRPCGLLVLTTPNASSLQKRPRRPAE
jgi:SAM-dependent methyltransferase